MIVNVGKKDKLILGPGTYTGLYFYALLTSTAVNTPQVPADFIPSAVQINATLAGKGFGAINFLNCNMLDLGMHCTQKRAMNEFVRGQVLTYAAGGAAEVRQYPIFYEFKSALRVPAGCTAIVEVSFTTGAQSSAITSNSQIVWDGVEGVANSWGIPVFNTYTITAGQNQETVALGDMVSNVLLINYNQTLYTTPVVAQAGIRSDKLNFTRNFNELVALDPSMFGNYPMDQYGATPPTASVTKFSKYLPQVFRLYDTDIAGACLNKAAAYLAFIGANVTASNNVIAWVNINTDRATVERSVRRGLEHQAENVQVLPPSGVVPA